MAVGWVEERVGSPHDERGPREGVGLEAFVEAATVRSEPPAQPGSTQVPVVSRGLGICDSVLDGAGSVRYDFTSGLSPRRLRSDTTLPGSQRIPRTATTVSVQPLWGTSAAALPVPWL